MSDRQEDAGWWLASDGKWYPPESHPSAMERSAGETSVRYAGFWIRFVAFVIDAIILNIAFGIITEILGLEGGNVFGADPDEIAFGSATALSLIGQWLYEALMTSSSTQATVGKMALNIKVTDLEGGRITFGRATGRHFAKYVSAIILLIGFIMAGFTARKQALHDMMAGTYVVKGGPR